MKHDVFHVSMLRKYVFDPRHVIKHDEVVLSQDLSYEEKPVAILKRKVQVLRSKHLRLVRVMWNHQGQEEATWELEDKIAESYSDLPFKAPDESCSRYDLPREPSVGGEGGSTGQQPQTAGAPQLPTSLPPPPPGARFSRFKFYFDYFIVFDALSPKM